jgi:hypothetical protein
VVKRGFDYKKTNYQYSEMNKENIGTVIVVLIIIFVVVIILFGKKGGGGNGNTMGRPGSRLDGRPRRIRLKLVGS